jgi:nicotinamidase-related amidase
MGFKNKALIIVDMQKDVLKKMVKSGVNIVSEVKTALDISRKKSMHIIYLVRMHRKNGTDVERFRCNLFKDSPFLVEGTSGVEIIEELKPFPTEYIVNKKRFSGFFQTDLLMILMRLKVTSLVICGVQTPNCIRATVTDALAYDFDVTVLEDATAAQTSEVHLANLFDMRNMGADVKTVKEFFSAAK